MVGSRVEKRLNISVGRGSCARGTPSYRHCERDTTINLRLVPPEEGGRRRGRWGERIGCTQTPVRVLSRPERTLHADELNILYFVTVVLRHLCDW